MPASQKRLIVSERRAKLAVEPTTQRDDTGAEPARTPGTCGTVTGVALKYNTPDYYGTMFLPGCLDKTRAQKLAAGKIKLFADHDHVTHAHVGVVRELRDVGDSVVMIADLLDTAAGREEKEYLDACIKSGAFTGLSVGVFEREGQYMKAPDGTDVWGYSEVECDEVSLTPVPAVPGTEVMAIRSKQDPKVLMETALRGILAALPKERIAAIVAEYALPAAPPAAAAPVPEPTTASPASDANGHTPADSTASATTPRAYLPLDERRKLVRASLAH